MAYPTPVPGLVIRYSYLWHSEHAQGREDGIKDRPCAVILVTVSDRGETIATVLPITHTVPTTIELAIEIPHATKRRLGLDDARSWVLLTEANRFVWPGPDVRPRTPKNTASVAYGLLPYALFEDIRIRFVAARRARQTRTVPRTD